MIIHPPVDLDDYIMLTLMIGALIALVTILAMMAWKWVFTPVKKQPRFRVYIKEGNAYREWKEQRDGCTVSPYIARHSGEDHHAYLALQIFRAVDVSRKHNGRA